VSEPIKRRSRLVRYLGIAALLCIAVLVADSESYYVVPVTGDAMDWVSHFLAGFGGINCGRIGVRGDPSAATKCALEANAEGHPFRVVYNLPGIDASAADGFVRTRHGAILALRFSGCSTGCGFSLLQQRVQIKPCPQPYHLYINPKGRLNCFQEQLSYRPWLEP
jgi:hypothetical protein